MNKPKFKNFTPRIDRKRRLVLFRWYAGIDGANSFCYTINKITKKETIDKRFKYLFVFGTDDVDSIGEFKRAQTGEIAKVFKTAFRSVFGLANGDKCDALAIWKSGTCPFEGGLYDKSSR